MAYKGFIEIENKKDWKKVFSKKELKQISFIFYNHFKKNSSNFNENDDYFNNLKNNVHTLHCDTGVWDDTCGIRPKQVKKFISIFGIKILKTALDYIQYKWDNEANRGEFSEFSEEHNFTFYDFNEFWKSLEFTDKDLKSFRKEQKEILIRKEIAVKEAQFSNALKEVRFGEEFYGQLDENFQKEIKDNFFKEDSIDFDKIFESNKASWKKEQGFVPQVTDMLVINPKMFNKDAFLESLDKMFKIKQLVKLDKKNQKRFIDLYLIFGNELKDIPFHLLSEKDKYFFFNGINKNENGSNKALAKILSRFKNGIIPDLSLFELSMISYILTNNKEIYEKFMNYSDLFLKDIRKAYEIGEYFDKLSKTNYIHLLPYLMNMPKNALESLFKLDYNSILSMFDRNKDNKQTLPTIKFRIKDYEFEVIDKKDIRGYFCGYPFSCQYIGGIGARFTKYGYANEDSSFMIVSKKGSIVAQSWIWSLKDQVTFDSIEAKGDINKDIVREGYEKYTELLLTNKNVKKVTVGNCKQIFTKYAKSYHKLLNTDAGHCYDSESQYLVKER